MQKKIIALAVAALASSAAFAQSNVTVYGVVDIGFSHQSSHTTAATKNRSGLDDGLQSGSRIGFRGTEDLGNGLKASFVLETAVTNDVQQVSVDDPSGIWGGTNRQSFVALSGNFGTVAFGRQYTPQYGLKGKIDPFGQGLAGNHQRIFGADGVGRNDRVDNLMAYVSPNFSGFNVIAGYTINATGDEVAKDGGNNRVFAINPNYSNGPLFVGLNYHTVKNDTPGSTTDKATDLGASYDFGVVKVSAGYSTRKQDTTKNLRAYLLGASIPVSANGAVLVSYNEQKNKVADNKAKQWAVGYTHALSKRTNLYSAYANRSGDGWAGYKNELNIGLRHSF